MLRKTDLDDETEKLIEKIQNTRNRIVCLLQDINKKLDKMLKKDAKRRFLKKTLMQNHEVSVRHPCVGRDPEH